MSADLTNGILNDLASHALNKVATTINIVPVEQRGDVALNVALNAGVMGCSYIVMVLAPELAAREGPDGVSREAERLWRRVATAVGKARTDEQLSDNLQRVTRNFKPLDKHGRSIALRDLEPAAINAELSRRQKDD